MVVDQLLVCGSDIKIVVVKVEPNLVFINCKAFCDELDYQVSDITLASGDGGVV